MGSYKRTKSKTSFILNNLKIDLTEILENENPYPKLEIEVKFVDLKPLISAKSYEDFKTKFAQLTENVRILDKILE